MSLKLQNETIVIGDCPLAMKRNITKQLMRVRGSVRDSDSIRAGAARGGNSETRAFGAITVSSVKKRGLLHVTAHTRQGRCCFVIVLCNVGNVGCCLFQKSRITDLQLQRLIFYQLSC